MSVPLLISASLISSSLTAPAQLMKTTLPALAAKPGTSDPVALLLADKRSPQTRRAYASDLAGFFGGHASPEGVQVFLALSVPEVALRLSAYKADMLTRGLSEATINRRLAAVRSLLKFSYRLGLSQTDGRGLVDSEKVRAYRDTRGVDVKTLKKLVGLPAKVYGALTPRGARDTAILRLMAENALRRAEVCALNAADFSSAEGRLRILGKGRGTQKEGITLSPRCTEAVALHLALSQGRGKEGRAGKEGGALFESLDRRPEHHGARLSAGGLYVLIGDYGARLGLPNLTPHKLRHSAITAALDAGGTVREVQRLSRHAKLETLQRYDDSRADHQGKMSRLLSRLL